ncbi:AMP-binding protein [Micromonospora sp. NBC_01699]|uniref:condensation domain-containing protein n=1 Tax=Micromonospora sp. NBC_01699 TaxID=2975984 RepID=UPI002E2FAEAA|nr:condensation domain-containing protein [Micromonospora sp. NBC_01699]
MRTASTVPALLDARSVTEPDRTALIVTRPGEPTGERADPTDNGPTDTGPDRLTFGHWRTRADAVGHGLIHRGVRPGDRIGLHFDGLDWVSFAVAYAAVTSVGAVAVPLPERGTPTQLRDLLEWCGASGVIHGGDTVAPRAGWAATVDELDLGPAGPVHVPVEPTDLAQILFTSGTTGRPKAVAASHANLTFGLLPHPRRRPLAHSRHFLHAFPLGTNAAQTMLMQTIAAQPAALVLPGFDPNRFAALVAAYRVGTLFVVPAMAIELLNSGAADRHDLSSVLLLASTAAPLPGPVARALCVALPAATIVNNYTSTEAAPAHTTVVFDPDRPAALGRPAAGAELVIGDPDGVRLPPGTVGEVHLRADTVPRSYYRDPDASAAVFRDGWVRMGDLGYLDDDGYLHLVDRDSDVVKSGAFKVSTPHVEATLHEHPAVADAAVVGVPHPTMGTMLAAAVVARTPVDPAELRAFLAERLAPHERPTRLLLVDTLPRNDGGKLRKPELRDLFTARADPAHRPPPVTPAEVRLGALWARVLSTSGVGRNDDFFALGGDSLRATQLATLAGESFGVAVPASLAFDQPVLSAQARWLADAAPARPATPDPETPVLAYDEVPLSAQQENFFTWMYATEEPRDVGPISVAIRIRDEFDPELFTSGLRLLVHRHESLRTVFASGQDGHRAYVRPDCPPRVTVVAAVGADAEARREHAATVVRTDREHGFDLATGPLVRAVVVRLDADDHVLGLAVHHLVFDGWSMGVLLRELGLAYSALRAGRPVVLPPLPVPYPEAVRWTREQWSRTRGFWSRHLDGAPTGIEPFPGRRRAVRLRSDSLEFRLDRDAADRLRGFARDRGASTFMVVAAAWVTVLSRFTGATEIVIMSPVPGRTRPEFEPLLGCLVQSLLLRIDARADPTFDELLDRVRSTALAGIDHQYYPYAEFYPRFPNSAWLRFESWGGVTHFPGLDSEPFELPRALDADWPTPNGEPDLGVPELAMLEQPDGSISGWLLWNSYAFDRSTMERLAAMLVRLAAYAPERAGRRLSQLTEAT